MTAGDRRRFLKCCAAGLAAGLAPRARLALAAGLDPARVAQYAFAIGSAIVVPGAILAAMTEGLNPAVGAHVMLISLAATIVGGIVAYPINHWLVDNRLKHGCMTLPGADGPAPNLGHSSPEPPLMAHGARFMAVAARYMV